MIQLKPLFVLSTVVISASFLLSGCSEVKSDEAKKEEIILVPVIAEAASIGAINATYGTTTSLEAAAEAEVTARVMGIVTDILTEEGDYVEQGQILAQLEVDKPNLELKRATAKLNRLKSELRRNEKIYQKNLISSEAYERIKYQYEAQKAVTELNSCSLIVITSPLLLLHH